jgi:hypothetical protein
MVLALRNVDIAPNLLAHGLESTWRPQYLLILCNLYKQPLDGYSGMGILIGLIFELLLIPTKSAY